MGSFRYNEGLKTPRRPSPERFLASGGNSKLLKETVVAGDVQKVRYSPGEVVTRYQSDTGNSDPKRICVSHVEQNLTVSMQIRRFDAADECVQQKRENLDQALASHFACYTFCRIHKSVRVTPTMELRITSGT